MESHSGAGPTGGGTRAACWLARVLLTPFILGVIRQTVSLDDGREGWEARLLFLPRPRAIVCGYLLPSCRRRYLHGHAESAVRIAAESTLRYSDSWVPHLCHEKQQGAEWHQSDNPTPPPLASRISAIKLLPCKSEYGECFWPGRGRLGARCSFPL